jgi:hypothetical protein
MLIVVLLKEYGPSALCKQEPKCSHPPGDRRKDHLDTAGEKKGTENFSFNNGENGS